MSFQVPPTTTTASNTSGFSFGMQGTAAKPGFSFGASAATSGGGDADAAKLPAAFSAPPITTATSTAPATASIATTGNGFGVFRGVATTAASTATTITAQAATPVLSLGKTPTLGTSNAPITSAPAGGGFANLSTATKTTDSVTIASATQLTYSQLEEHINKWTLEFEEQEKLFIEQATQINAWDKILINNNQKILELNEAVQKVKSDQQLLEQELEFIATQHKELEESIAPLQKDFTNLPQVDVERSQTYLMVENLDTQLKQMSEDLKEIIDNLNESNKGQDNTDPIIQIGKILNAHMSSLQWIESSSTSICNKLDDISKMHETHKREAYRSAYYS